MLQNKKIILIGPSNYSYPLTIKKEIELDGGTVHFYDERNNPSSIQKILLRKAPFLVKNKMEKYYETIINAEMNFAPDYILFISPESVSKESITQMKKFFSKARFILYMWDSIENKNARKIYNLFDKCLSFDRNDCDKYGFLFRPLFFSREYETEIITDNEYLYDFGFIGTTHSDRARVIYNVEQYCKEHKLKYYFYLYIPGLLMFCLRYLQDPYVRKLHKEGLIHTNTLTRSEVENTMAHTRCVIDVNHPNQTGLTMRTIEMLGLKRKLLTTNNNIRNYDFYNPVNQIVIDRSTVIIDENVIKIPYQEIDNDVYLRYRIDYWVREVFE